MDATGGYYGIYLYNGNLKIESGADVTATNNENSDSSAFAIRVYNGNATIDSSKVTADGYNGFELEGGTLSISGETTEVTATGTVYGIYVCKKADTGGTITISGGTIDATGATAGIYSGDAMSISYADIKATSTAGDAIHSYDKISITGGTIYAYGLKSGIYADKTLDITNAAITATSTNINDDAYGIYANLDATITSSTIKLTADALDEAYGIYAASKLDISESDITATATTTSGTAYGICSSAAMTINKSTINATGKDYGIYGYATIYITGTNDDTHIIAQGDVHAIYGQGLLTVGEDLSAHGYDGSAYTDPAINNDNHYDETDLLIGSEMPNIAIDYVNATLTGFIDGKTYEMSTDNSIFVVMDLENKEPDIDGSWFGTTVYFAIEEGNSGQLSATQILDIPARPAKPTAEATDCTTSSNNDGTITGVNDTMEYSTDEITWTKVSGTEVTGLANGTYYVRVAAVADIDFATPNFAGETKTLTIAAYATSSSGSAKTYTNTLEVGDGGEAIATPMTVKAGTSVWITPTADENYQIDEIIVDDGDVTVTDAGDGTYSFKQPSRKVTIEVTFEYVGEEVEEETEEEVDEDESLFDDVDSDHWYADAVETVVDAGIMNGIGDDKFGPNDSTTRAMIVTMLWRVADEPVVNYLMTFEDVVEDSWYGEAVRWAASNGIVLGYSDEEFAPDVNITREQVAAILYRYMDFLGEDVSAAADLSTFTDYTSISDYAVDAMAWAVAKGYVNGYEDGTVKPTADITRAEIATIFARFLAE